MRKDEIRALRSYYFAQAFFDALFAVFLLLYGVFWGILIAKSYGVWMNGAVLFFISMYAVVHHAKSAMREWEKRKSYCAETNDERVD